MEGEREKGKLEGGSVVDWFCPTTRPCLVDLLPV